MIRQKARLNGTLPRDRYWACEPVALDELIAQLSRADLIELRTQASPFDDSAGGGFERLGPVAVIELNGPLAKYPSFWQKIFGGTSYMVAQAAVEQAAADPGIETIVLLVDSPGGEVSGLGDLANSVFKARASKRIVAYVSDLGASAAYRVACQAGSVVCNESALIGSIGTYGVVADWSELFAKAGVKVHVIRAGEYKGVGEQGTLITTEQLAEFERVVRSVNSLFVRDVQRGLGLSAGDAEKLADGRIHVAGDAKRLGLIHAIKPFDELLAELGAEAASSRPKARVPGAVRSKAKASGPKPVASAEPSRQKTEPPRILPATPLSILTVMQRKRERPGLTSKGAQYERQRELRQAREACLESIAKFDPAGVDGGAVIKAYRYAQKQLEELSEAGRGNLPTRDSRPSTEAYIEEVNPAFHEAFGKAMDDLSAGRLHL